MKSKREHIKESITVIIYFIKLVHQIKKSYIPILLLQSFLQALIPFIMVIGPKLIIDELMTTQDVSRLTIIISAIVATSFILNLLLKIVKYHTNYMYFQLLNGLDCYIGSKTVDIAYECIEDPDILDLKERAIFAIFFQNSLERILDNIVKVLNTGFIMLGLAALIWTLNPLVILALIIMVTVNGRVFKRIQKVSYESSQSSVPINRAYNYYIRLSSDHELAKDIRLYNMRPPILKKMKAFSIEIFTLFERMYTSIGKLNGLTNVNLQVQSVLVYAYLVYRVIAKTVTIGEFTMYTSAISKFSDAMRDFVSSIIEVDNLSKYLKLLMEYDQLPNAKDSGDQSIPKEDELEVKFENVWFKYPRSHEYTLKDINVTLHPGEKISIIGLNGAGKTTFVKLLTRLYVPTKGRITLNGIDIKKINYSEYIEKISAVFQDYRLFGMSIQENVSSKLMNEDDEEHVVHYLNEAGVMNEINKMPEGIRTPLERRFDKNATQLSGGQSQKVAIARALYKNAPIVVLDEPTAALDPIAEHDIYARFDQLVGNKTAIYISHRLSSCQFCDRILVFDNGNIIQDGHHEVLIKDIGNRYHEMYSAQAEYYA